MSGAKTPARAKPKRGPLCWLCNRKFMANRCTRILVDGHVREVHSDCARREHPEALPVEDAPATIIVCGGKRLSEKTERLLGEVFAAAMAKEK